ncbi:MAG: hypothetical protein QXQ39_03720 [Conexivisphaerales archaeon]
MIQVEPCIIPQQDSLMIVRRLKSLGFRTVGAELNDNFTEFVKAANSEGLNVFRRVSLRSSTDISVAGLRESVESKRIPKLLAVDIEEGIDLLNQLSPNQALKIMAIEVSFSQLRELFNKDAYVTFKSLSKIISAAKLKKIPILYASYAKRASELVAPPAYDQIFEMTYGKIPLDVRRVLQKLSEEYTV